MTEHERYMRMALEQARQAFDADETPVGAVIVRNGEFIAAERNRREESNDPTAHAEVLALRAAAQRLGTRRLNDCTLYVTLEPCPMCAGAMVMSCLGRCFFGASDERQGCCESVYALPNDPAFYHRLPCIGGLLAEEAQALLKDFFAKRRLSTPKET